MTVTDPTFYRSAAEAAAAPRERLAYVVAFDRAAERPDALTVVDVDEESATYGQLVGWADLPTRGDELHHFGWNACSSALKHEGHDMHGLERRYLLLPGLRSSNVHVYDTQPDPSSPQLLKTIDAKELAANAGYSRPHTLHCGPDGIFLSCLGGADGNDGPGGIALLDHTTFDVLRAWETDRGPQYLAYDAWWHLNQNVAITSEWGTPSMIEDGIVPELLLGQKYGHALHFWDLADGRHLQTVDLGAQHQMVLELRPSHDPEATWGFVGVVVSTEDLSASIWRWHRDGDTWTADKVITIPAEPADPRTAAARAAALRCRAAAGHRHQPLRRRPHALRLLLGDRRAQAVRRDGPGTSARGRVRPPRRDRRAGRPPRVARGTAGGRTADGGGEPGRRPRLHHELALRRLGRPVLPGRRRRLDGEDRRRPGGRDARRRAVLPARRRLPRPAGAPGAAAGRRRVVGLVLLPLRHAHD